VGWGGGWGGGGRDTHMQRHAHVWLAGWLAGWPRTHPHPHHCPPPPTHTHTTAICPMQTGPAPICRVHHILLVAYLVLQFLPCVPTALRRDVPTMTAFAVADLLSCVWGSRSTNVLHEFSALSDKATGVARLLRAGEARDCAPLSALTGKTIAIEQAP
jgi:hypothetical protein